MIDFPLILIMALSSFASAPQLPSEDECVRLHPGIASPVEFAACTSDLAGSKQALAVAMSELRSRVPVEDRQRLDEAQRAWVAYRDAQCAWDADGYPGNTANSSAIIACTAAFDRDRAKALREEAQDRGLK